MRDKQRQEHVGASAPRLARRILIGLLALVLVVVGLYVYDYIRINLWIERDAGQLEQYSVRLIENEREVARPANGRFEQIDRLLIGKMRKEGRNVVTLSRSEIKFNLLRTRAYVKVFLETALPDKPDRRVRLRAICPLRRTGQGWQLAGEPLEKTIE